MNHYQKLATVVLRLLAVVLAGIGLLYVAYGVTILPIMMGSNPLTAIPAALGNIYLITVATGSGWIIFGTLLYAVSASLGRLIGKGM
ncbi:MAG: hypothetical protein H7145_12825 [Akkermansiaceae bacterium]|nr:hypothetical protein [Armatimonadota bacterium]